ncbi:hypothetical protein [Dactylosporangium sp. NPDC050588]|uniref:hypothetical protein n=1 Tax=Dactylosporangium sp. NPDC050588 TaxID=3157211 RepID=UPI0033FAD7FA
MTTGAGPHWNVSINFAGLLAEIDEDGPAAAVLAGVLRGLDPATELPDEQVIEAAMLYSRLVEPTPDLVPDEVAWAEYADRAARARYGRELIQIHLDHGDIDAHLIQRMELAEQLHAQGCCDEAVRQAEATWRDWINRYDPTGPELRWIMLQFVSMIIACHRIDEAQALRSFAKFELPTSEDPIKAGYDAFIVTVPAMLVHHRPVCARQNSTATAASGLRGVC